MMKRTNLLVVLALVLAPDCFSQGVRPPADLLTLQRDVNISSPTDHQPFVFDSGSGKWINSSTLNDLVIYDSANSSNAADFTTQILSSKGVDVLDWSNQKLKPLVPMVDGSGNSSVDVANRKLYKTDGSTVLFDYSGSAPKFPTLTNSDTKVFLRADASGNITNATIPSAGTIPATTAILQGDGSGNASQSKISVYGANQGYEQRIDSAGLLTVFQITNTVGGAGLILDGSTGPGFLKMAESSSGMVNAGDMVLSAGAVGNLVIGSGGPFVPILFGTDLTGSEKVRILNGLMVGTTTDPGGGVVNVSSGYRIGNVAANYQSLVGNGTSFVAGNIPGKVSVTSTVDQTATTETAHVTYTVNANTVSVGTTFRITAWGDMDNGSTAITFTPRIRWGGTGGTQLIATPAVTSINAVLANKTWRASALVTIRTTGATGTATCSLMVSNHNSTVLGPFVQDEADSGGTAVTIDTTANKDLALTWALSSTTGTPHVRTYGGSIEVVKP